MRTSGKYLLLCALVFMVVSCQSSGVPSQDSGIHYDITHEIDLSSAAISQLELHHKENDVDHEKTFLIARLPNGNITAIKFQDDSDYERDLVSGLNYEEFMLGEIAVRIEYLGSTSSFIVEYSPNESDAGVDIVRR